MSTQVATGLDFGFGLSLTGLYGETTTDRYQSIGGGQRLAVIYQREWPSGQLRFSRPFSTGPFALLALGATLRAAAGFDDAAVSSTIVAVMSNQSRNLSPELGLTFRNGVTLASNLNLLKQQTSSNGSVTLLDQADLNGSLSYAFPLPRALSRVAQAGALIVQRGGVEGDAVPHPRPRTPTARSFPTPAARSIAAASIPISSPP